MSKPIHRNRCATQSQAQSPNGADQSSAKPARCDAPEARHLLDRILNTPRLEHVIPRLQPNLLHRVIQSCGLEDCGELVALATPEQLAHIFDLDLWRAARAGMDEQFDADRFGVWIEVLLESGAAVAAQKLAGMDVELVVTGLAQHILAYDRAAVTPYETLEGEQVTFYADAISVFDKGLTFDFGGYLLMAKRADSWEAIVEVLTALGDGHPDYFNQVIRGCVTLSNSGHEEDGLDDLLHKGDQAMFDQAAGRDDRRDKQGYVTPAQARAFLQMSRELQFGSDAMPPANPLAQAYFRTIEKSPGTQAGGETRLLAAGSEPSPIAEDTAEAVAAVYDVLHEAGILEQAPRALPGGSEEHASRLSHIQAQMQLLLDRDPAAYSTKSEELAYLANTLMAGCSLQARPFTAHEASDAVLAICNLGLENWPPHWRKESATAIPAPFLIDHDLISVFQVGWAVLHKDVSMYAAEQLIGVLNCLRCNDHEIQPELDALSIELTKHWRAGAPWQARDALDVIATLDVLAWAVLLALIDECPVLHAGVNALKDSRIHSVSTTDFEFISENSQIASVHEFMQSLLETLRP